MYNNFMVDVYYHDVNFVMVFPPRFDDASVHGKGTSETLFKVSLWM